MWAGDTRAPQCSRHCERFCPWRKGPPGGGWRRRWDQRPAHSPCESPAWEDVSVASLQPEFPSVPTAPPIHGLALLSPVAPRPSPALRSPAPPSRLLRPDRAHALPSPARSFCSLTVSPTRPPHTPFTSRASLPHACSENLPSKLHLFPFSYHLLNMIARARVRSQSGLTSRTADHPVDKHRCPHAPRERTEARRGGAERRAQDPGRTPVPVQAPRAAPCSLTSRGLPLGTDLLGPLV